MPESIRKEHKAKKIWGRGLTVIGNTTVTVIKIIYDIVLKPENSTRQNNTHLLNDSSVHESVMIRVRMNSVMKDE